MSDDYGPLRVGDVLHGFCGGAFGRESYGDKQVEAIGSDWVVAREVDTDHPVFTTSVGFDVATELREYR